jgi:predicted ribosome quality control (RQC) complex YloA/Tae2 family protein
MEWLTLEALARELDHETRGARVDRIHQYGLHDLVLELWTGNRRKRLLITVDADRPGAHLANADPDELRTHSPLLAAARSRLRPGTVTHVSMPEPWERLLWLDVRTSTGEQRLVLEAIPRASSLLLLDPDGVVVAALGAALRSARGLTPGRPYRRPARPEPWIERATPAELTSVLATTGGELEGPRLLARTYPGLSPMLAREIWDEAQGRPDHVHTSLHQLVQRARRDPRPCIVERRGRPLVLSYVPKSAGDAPHRLCGSFLEACRTVHAEAVTARRVAERRARLVRALERRRRKLQVRVSSVLEDGDAEPRAAELISQGEMLLAYQYQIDPSLGRVQVPRPDGERAWTLELDPALDVPRNAKRLFGRARKLRRAAQVAGGRLNALRLELEQLDELQVSVETSAAGELHGLEEELTGLGLLRRPRRERPAARQSGQRRASTPSSLTPRRFQATGGAQILVGRSSRGNDHLTFELMNREDYWLHAAAPGSHVVLRNPNRLPEPPSGALLEAASLAAWYSRLRRDTQAEVHWTTRREVRRIPGAPPGRVSLGRHQTVRVSPDLARRRFNLEEV